MARRIRTPLLWAVLMPALVVAGNASATPSFSRQVHADCRTCHFQDMHALNHYGREFKQNAFHETKAMRKHRLEQQEHARRDRQDS